MATDLKTVNDRPVTILKRHFQGEPEISDIIEGTLDQYESINAVTFAALDNQALADVRDAYAAFDTSTPDNALGLYNAFMNAVVDLLGLGD